MSIFPVPATLPLSLPSDDESRLVDRLLNDLSLYEASNALKAAYYEGEQRVQMLNISIPPSLSRLETVAGWPGTVVDVLEERLDWYGWTSDAEGFDLDQVYRDNMLDVEAGNVHLDALIYGTAFAVVGSGEGSSSSPLVTMHSPRSLTGRWDARRRRLGAALSAASGAWMTATGTTSAAFPWCSSTTAPAPHA